MKIRWLGHSCFLITSSDGLRVMTDPYTPGGELRYAPIRETADIVTVSHGHFDHGNVGAVGGKPEVLRQSGTVHGIRFSAVETFHDGELGRQRGRNTVFVFVLDGIKLAHFGDLGHELSTQQLEQVGAIDVAMVPVGGYYTIGPGAAWELCQQVKARVILPMHYRTAKVGMPIAPIDDFIRGRSGVRKLEVSEVELVRERLPQTTEIIVLKSAL
jgi:L-ascorbate metabolism protein UlaG (beta-lactamase superfamily)